MDERTGKKKSSFITLPCSKAGSSKISDPIEPCEMVPDSPEPKNASQMNSGLEVIESYEERPTSTSSETTIMEEKTGKRKSSFITLPCSKAGSSKISDVIEPSEVLPGSPEPKNASHMNSGLEVIESHEERPTSTSSETTIIEEKTGKKKSSFIVLTCGKSCSSKISDAIEPSEMVPDSPKTKNASQMNSRLEVIESCKERPTSTSSETDIMKEKTGKKKSSFFTLPCGKAGSSKIPDPIEPSEMAPDSPKPKNAHQMTSRLQMVESYDKRPTSALSETFIMEKRAIKRKSSFVTLPCSKAGSSKIPVLIQPSVMVPDSLKPKNARQMMSRLQIVESYEKRPTSVSSENLSMISLERLLNYTESQFKNLVDKFISGGRKENLCESILQITVLCLSERFIQCPVYQKLTAKVLKSICIYKNPGVLMLSQGLFMSIIAQQNLDDENLELIREVLVSYFKSINDPSFKYYNEDPGEATIHHMPDAFRQLTEYILMHDSKPKMLASEERNTFFLWCDATVNILSKKTLVCPAEMDFSLAVRDSIILRSEFLHGLCSIESFDVLIVNHEVNHTLIVHGLSKIEICFDVLQIMLANKALIKTTLYCYETVILTIIKWFLIYFMKEVFVKKSSNDIISALKATAMSMLKLLLALSTIECNDLERDGIFLVEKLLHLIIQAHFSTFKERFGLQVMSLEACLLILENKWIPKELYCFILRKETELMETELVIVDALIKVLLHSLDEIKLLENVKINTTPGMVANFLVKPFPYEDVQQLGEDHMEHNFIVSYVSVLLALFCVENETYKTHIQNNIQRSDANVCVNVLHKFRQFLVLMKNFNPIGESLIKKTTLVFQDF